MIRLARFRSIVLAGVLATAVGCGASHTDAGTNSHQADTAEGSTSGAQAALDLLNAYYTTDLPTMKIAASSATRASINVEVWEYKLSPGGFIVSGLNSTNTVDGQPGFAVNRVALVVNREGEDALALHGMAWIDEHVSADDVQGFLADAHNDYDAAVAAIGGDVPEVDNPYSWPHTFDSRFECMAGPGAGAILSAVGGFIAISWGTSMCMTGLGCSLGGAAIIAGATIVAVDVADVAQTYDICMER